MGRSPPDCQLCSPYSFIFFNSDRSEPFHIHVKRDRQYNDAEDYVKVLRQMNPAIAYEIMSDPPIAPDRNGGEF